MTLAPIALHISIGHAEDNVPSDISLRVCIDVVA